MSEKLNLEAIEARIKLARPGGGPISWFHAVSIVNEDAPALVARVRELEDICGLLADEFDGLVDSLTDSDYPTRLIKLRLIGDGLRGILE